jgi:hypothetical protein
LGPLAAVSIIISTPLALIFSILGLFFDGRKWYAITGLVISGAMGALIGSALAISLCR